MGFYGGDVKNVKIKAVEPKTVQGYERNRLHNMVDDAERMKMFTEAIPDKEQRKTFSITQLEDILLELRNKTWRVKSQQGQMKSRSRKPFTEFDGEIDAQARQTS